MPQTRQGKVSEPVGLSALGSVTKSPEALGGLVVGLGAPKRSVCSSGQGLALAFLPPAAPTLLTGTAALSLLKLCGMSRMNPSFLWSAVAPPPALDFSIFVLLLLQDRNTSSLRCDLFVST